MSQKGWSLLTMILILIFLGLIVNNAPVAFINNTLSKGSLQRKVLIMFLVENIVIFYLFITKIDVLPKWFSYEDIIEFEYKSQIHKKSIAENRKNMLIKRHSILIILLLFIINKSFLLKIYLANND